MKSYQIYSMGTKFLNPFQRKNTGMSKVNSSSTTVWMKELISLPILVFHLVIHSRKSQFRHLRICMLVGFVAINVQQPLMDSTVHWQMQQLQLGAPPTMCTHPKCQRLAATIVEEKLELATTIVEQELELVAPFLPINGHRERAAKWERLWVQ